MSDEVTGRDVLSQAKGMESAQIMQIASSFPEIVMLLEAAISENGSPDHTRAMLP